jgi:hypothetical protein
MSFVVLAEPFLVNRIGERCASPIQCGLRKSRDRQGKTQKRDATNHAMILLENLVTS